MTKAIQIRKHDAAADGTETCKASCGAPATWVLVIDLNRLQTLSLGFCEAHLHDLRREVNEAVFGYKNGGAQ